MTKHRSLFYLFALFFVPLVLTSCHSRKAAMKGQPGEIVKPQIEMADKYSQIMGVDRSDIENGRL